MTPPCLSSKSLWVTVTAGKTDNGHVEELMDRLLDSGPRSVRPSTIVAPDQTHTSSIISISSSLVSFPMVAAPSG